MAWHTLTDAAIAVPIGRHINLERTGAGIVAGLIDDFRQEAVA